MEVIILAVGVLVLWILLRFHFAQKDVDDEVQSIINEWNENDERN